MKYPDKTKLTEKRINESFKAAISKDETRPAMRGVYHSEELQALVALDGYKMVVSKSRYTPALKNVIIDPKTYVQIDREYPRIAPIIPDFSKLAHVSVTLPDFIKGCKETVYMLRDYTMTPTKPSDTSSILFAVNPKFIAHLVGQTLPMAYAENLGSPLLTPVFFDLNVWKAGDFWDYYLTMPLKV